MQTKTYKTRVSVLLMIIIMIIVVTPLILNHPQEPEQKIVVYSSVLIVAVLVVSIINIKYVIDNDTLKIYTFFWFHKDIKIDSIWKMEPSRCILSSPAASLKRLAIHYNKFDVVYISPRNQEDFINEINKRKKRGENNE